MAVAGSHGLVAVVPMAAAICDWKFGRTHVDGMNCAGPIAPPHPIESGQETFIDCGSKPSVEAICRKGGISRVGFITRDFTAPVVALTPAPVL